MKRDGDFDVRPSRFGSTITARKPELLVMAGLYRRAMDYLYLLCVIVGVTALVLISAVIPWAVFTRYILNSAASWPEPLAVLLTILLTFVGAAAGYRLNLHMNVSYFVDQLPAPWRRFFDLLVQLLMALIAIFMVIWGESLVEVTWHNSIADFPFLSVGVTYLPIPVGGVCLLLFIIERIFLGAPPDPIAHQSHSVSID
jgi:TRAP-type C4-dicarboxylate transport system permease small subunit